MYLLGGWVTGFIVFVGAWIWCVSEYGFLVGVGLGWFPSAIVAVIAGWLWPLVLTAVLYFASKV
jgi:hypothetical protein